MTIASAFNDIAVAQGGTASQSGTIAGAIDALNDALAGSDQESCQTIEGAVRLLGEHIGGGSSVTVEALTATENKTYTAPEGKAYSPVTVNVSGGGSSVNHTTMPVIAEDAQGNPIPSPEEIQHIYYIDNENQFNDISFTTTTYTYDDGETTPFETTALVADLLVGYPMYAVFPQDVPANIIGENACIESHNAGAFVVLDPSEFGNAIVVLQYSGAPF